MVALTRFRKSKITGNLVVHKNGSAYKQKNTNDNEFMDVGLKIYTEQRVARWQVPRDVCECCARGTDGREPHYRGGGPQASPCGCFSFTHEANDVTKIMG